MDLEAPSAKDNGRGVVITALAELPPDAHLDAEALGRILSRSRKTILRMARRGELPAPFRMGGRYVWLVGVILSHFKTQQEAALRVAKRRDQRLVEKYP